MYPSVWPDRHLSVSHTCTACMCVQRHFQIDFTLQSKSLILCRYQECGRRSIRESAICPGTLLLKKGKGWQHPWTICHRGWDSNSTLFPCVCCQLSSIPVPICLRSHSRLVTMLVASQQLWLLEMMAVTSPIQGWALPAGSCKDSCPDNRVLRGSASKLLPASRWVEVHPEGSWHFVQSTDHGLCSLEWTCVKEEQLCCAPALIS